MGEIFDTFIKAIVTAAAGGFLTALVMWLKSVHKKNQVYENAIKALAHDSFYKACRELIRKEFITEDELENLNYLHDAYTALGMNGTGEELYKRCVEKEIR